MSFLFKSFNEHRVSQNCSHLVESREHVLLHIVNDYIVDAAGDLVMSPIPGVAGIDYPEFNTVPDTGFDCAAQETPGIYTDTEARCQVTCFDKIYE